MERPTAVSGDEWPAGPDDEAAGAAEAGAPTIATVDPAASVTAVAATHVASHAQLRRLPRDDVAVELGAMSDLSRPAYQARTYVPRRPEHLKPRGPFEC